MEMRDGMLGVVIIAIAISIALFGSYLAGVTPHEEEYTNFEYLTDVNVLFDYDTTPRYIDYDPSANYTGYYSTDSYSDFIQGYYFAEDQVGFTPNNTTNNYKLNIEPQGAEEGVFDFRPFDAVEGGYPFTDPDHRVSWTYKPTNATVSGTGYVTLSNRTAVVSKLSTVVEHMGLNDDVVKVYIASENPIVQNMVGGATHDLGWMIFAPLKNWVYSGGVNTLSFYDEAYVKQHDVEYGQQIANIIISKMALACEIDLVESTATIYYGNTFDKANLGPTYKLDEVTMVYGGTESGTTNFGWNGYFNLAHTGNYRYEGPQEKTYLNPMYGVHLKEETA